MYSVKLKMKKTANKKYMETSKKEKEKVLIEKLKSALKKNHHAVFIVGFDDMDKPAELNILLDNMDDRMAVALMIKAIKSHQGEMQEMN